MHLAGFLLSSVAASARVALRRTAEGPRHPRWGYRYEVIVEIMREAASRVRSVHELRAALPPAFVHPALRASLSHERGELAGRAAETFTPAQWTPRDPTILYLHGGGYVLCSPETHRDLVSRIAQASGARCVVLDYRKAPEHPFPAAVDDAAAAYDALVARGDARRLVVAGDSAGGGLALATLLRARDRGLPLAAGALLLSPWVDLERSGGAGGERLDYIDERLLEMAATSYLTGRDPTDPHASPLHADLSGLPPLLIQSGGAELLLAQNRRLAERARQAGVEVTHDVEEGMVHVFQALAIAAPEPRAAIARIGAFLRRIQREAPRARRSDATSQLGSGTSSSS